MKIRHVIIGILPYVITTSLRPCIYSKQCRFRHVEAEEKPSKKSKKGGSKGSVAMLNESLQLACEAQDSCPRKSILHKEGKLGSKHAVKFFQGTWHQIKIRERKGPSRGIIPTCELYERSPCAPKFGEISHEDTLHQERCARKVAWDSAKLSTSSRMRTKLRLLYYSFKARRMPAFASKSPEEQEFVVDSGVSTHMLSKKGFNLR